MANFQVFIYPNDWTLWDDSQTVEEGLVEAAGILEDYGSIESFSIDTRIDMPEVSGWESFEGWRKNNYDDIGLHLWLSGSYGKGRANEGKPHSNAWNDPKQAKIHTSTADYHGFKKELAVHEALHPHLWSPATDEWIDDSEHDLGGVEYVDGGWRVTPLACSYKDTHLQHGHCTPFYGYEGYTVEPSYCTKEAIKACNPSI